MKCTSTDSVSKENITMSSSSHDIKLNSCINDKSLTPYNNIDNVDDIPSDSYFFDSISLSDFETSFYKYVAETNKGIYIIDLELQHKNCDIMNNTYGKLRKHFNKPDTCCTSSEWYLKSIVSELTIQYLISYDNNAKGEKLDEDHQFPDWSCWDSLYDSIGEHLLDDEEDMKEYIHTPFFHSRKDFRKL